MLSVSTRSTPRTSNQGSSSLDMSSLNKIKKLFSFKRPEDEGEKFGSGSVMESLGLSETISFIGDVDDKLFETFLPDPISEWKLDPFFTSDKTEPQEVLAILEALICISRVHCQMSTSIKRDLIITITDNILCPSQMHALDQK